MKLPESHKDLLTDESLKAFAVLATVMEDGSPQVTPIWFSWDGEHVLLNSAKGRVKDRNMRQRPEVAVSIQDPRNPYRYIQIRGKVVDVTEQGAREHINQLSKKYTGNPVYQGNPSETRVIYKIEPEHINVMG